MFYKILTTSDYVVDILLMFCYGCVSVCMSIVLAILLLVCTFWRDASLLPWQRLRSFYKICKAGGLLQRRVRRTAFTDINHKRAGAIIANRKIQVTPAGAIDLQCSCEYSSCVCVHSIRVCLSGFAVSYRQPTWGSVHQFVGWTVYKSTGPYIFSLQNESIIHTWIMWFEKVYI